MLSRKMTLKELDELGADADLARVGAKSDEDLVMQDKCDANDKVAAEINAEHMKHMAEAGGFCRLLAYNRPKILIVVACLASMVNGAAQPVMGIVLARMLTILGPTLVQLG